MTTDRVPLRLVLQHCDNDPSRPLALHTEDGRPLPDQCSVTINNRPGEFVSVTVTFAIGEGVTIAETPERPGTALPPLEGMPHG